MLTAALAAACDRTDRREPNGAVGTSGTVDTNQATSADRDFVRDLGIANAAEIELAKLASDHAANAQVKKFAQMMIDDHSKARDSLNAVAEKHNITTTALVDQKHRDLKEKLAGLKGAEFDREYIDAMVDGHKDVLDKLEARVDKDKLADWKTQLKNRMPGTPESNVSVTPERSDNAATMAINAWAAQTYPTVASHHDKATALNDTLKKGRPTTN